MNEGSGCELQQLVQEEEGEERSSQGEEATPPSTPARSSNRRSKSDKQNSSISVRYHCITYISSVLKILSFCFLMEEAL